MLRTAKKHGGHSSVALYSSHALSNYPLSTSEPHRDALLPSDASADSITPAHCSSAAAATPTQRAAAAMDDAKRLAETALKTAKKYADESPLQTLRMIEWGCCFLAWTLLASAHRSKFDGLYEYQNYTPLTFLLSGLVMNFLKLPALYVAEHGFRVDQALLRKVELYGSMYMTAWLGIGFIAAASASSVLHDEFGGASTCGPSNGTHQQKRKASYFCARVDAAISFAFFAFLASAASLFLVVRNRSRPSEEEDDEEANPLHNGDASPVKDADGRTFEPSAFGRMDALSGNGDGMGAVDL